MAWGEGGSLSDWLTKTGKYDKRPGTSKKSEDFIMPSVMPKATPADGDD